MIIKFRHLGIVVSDLYESQQFYENVLGFKKILSHYENSSYFKKVNGIDAEASTMKLATPDGKVIELLEYKKSKSKNKIHSDHNAIGKIHQCYQVSDIQKTFTRLKANAIKTISEPQKSPDAPAIVFTAYDPDDNLIEFVEITGKMPEGLQ